MMGGDGQLFLQIGLVIIVASVLSLAFARMRQPMIVAYMVAGLLVGPGVLGLVESSGMFEALSQVGVAFLLFLVGVHLHFDGQAQRAEKFFQRGAELAGDDAEHIRAFMRK